MINQISIWGPPSTNLNSRIPQTKHNRLLTCLVDPLILVVSQRHCSQRRSQLLAQLFETWTVISSKKNSFDVQVFGVGCNPPGTKKLPDGPTSDISSGMTKSIMFGLMLNCTSHAEADFKLDKLILDVKSNFQFHQDICSEPPSHWKEGFCQWFYSWNFRYITKDCLVYRWLMDHRFFFYAPKGPFFPFLSTTNWDAWETQAFTQPTVYFKPTSQADASLKICWCFQAW